MILWVCIWEHFSSADPGLRSTKMSSVTSTHCVTLRSASSAGLTESLPILGFQRLFLVMFPKYLVIALPLVWRWNRDFFSHIYQSWPLWDVHTRQLWSVLYRNIIPIRTGARKRAALKRALPPNQSHPDVWQHTLRVVFPGMLDLFDNWFSIVVLREELLPC